MATNKYLEVSWTIYFHVAEPVTLLAITFEQIYSTRHQLPPMKEASNPIIKKKKKAASYPESSNATIAPTGMSCLTD